MSNLSSLLIFYIYCTLNLNIKPVVADMSSLSGKSDKEISQLLDEYGIKHGPIVGMCCLKSKLKHL